jgi:hypothetical protein
MITTLDNARTLVDNLHQDIEVYRRMPRDEPQFATRARQIVQRGVGVVETIREAQRELESELERLDAIKEEVSSRLNPGIEAIYQNASDIMNGYGQGFDALYEEYYRGMQLSMLGTAPVIRKPRMSYPFPLDSFRAASAANAILIVGILVALAFSRLEITPHGATFIGFLSGTIVAIIAKVVGTDRSRLPVNGHERHAQTH